VIKKLFSLLLILTLIISASVASFAVMKGLSSELQSVVKMGENITIPKDGHYKSAVAIGGSVVVQGHVVESVVAVGGSVYLNDTAVVNGDVVAVGGKIIKSAGATATGDTVEVAMPAMTPMMAFFTSGGMLQGVIIFKLLSLIGFLALAIIMVAMFTPQLGKISSSVEKELAKNFLLGLLLAVLIVPIALLLMISVIGIVLIPVWIVLVAAAGFIGYFAGAHLLGKQALHAFKVFNKSMMVETLLGVIILALVGLTPIAGFLVKLIVICCGLGAVYQTRFGTK